MAKSKQHIDIDLLGSQDEKLTAKESAEISEQIKLMKAARKKGRARLPKVSVSKKAKEEA